MSESSMVQEEVAKIAQACFASNPVVILGSGASAPHGLPGMDALRDFLLANVVPYGEEETHWWTVITTALAAGEHLEQALTGKALPSSLTSKIVRQTWECINSADKAVFLKNLVDAERLPVGNLLGALLASSNKTVDVVTTNYDRLAEYACNSVGLLYAAGFTAGYIQRRELDPIIRVQAGKQVRTIKIWKVHGSLDWFERNDSTLVSAPIYEMPADGLLPLIVTPGFNKFERTHDEPFRSAIQGADRALEQSEGYLCIGFGFRDTHIEPKLLQRCREKRVPVTVIARTLTEEAKAFLSHKAGPLYLGMEQCEVGTRVFYPAHPEGIDIPGVEYHSVDGFLSLVT